MMHPGLPEFWSYIVWAFMLMLSLWFVFKTPSKQITTVPVNLSNIKLIKPFVDVLINSYWPLTVLKIAVLIVFMLVIYAGLIGSPVPERNIATVLTWNIWWSGLIVSIFFFGSSWCAVCPWDTLADLFVKPRLWLKYKINNSLELTPPEWMRSVWPALFLFVGLSWLELGVGITTNPYWTALLALLLVVLATVTRAIFKNKAFCHYICPVGRTVGFYAQLAPIELRPINSDICASCTTLECFHGSDNVEACPTNLVMGRLSQNTYCTSCGNCVKSCPDKNIFWRIRSHSSEAMHSARPHWDEAWFMLSLLALTSFHGITMMQFWESWMKSFAQLIGDSGQLLISFSIGLGISMIVPAVIFTVCVYLTHCFSKTDVAFKKTFSSLVFISLPLAFCYHLAHNLNHMIRESVGASQLFYNPLGSGFQSVELSEKVFKEYNMLISQDALFSLQALLMMFGFFVAIKILRHRGHYLLSKSIWSLTPMLIFILLINGFNLWMLSQPMLMRLGMCVAPA